MYPRFSETFILNEILGLEERGWKVVIYSLKKPNDGKFHQDLSRVKARARYVPEQVMYALPDYGNALWYMLRRSPAVTLRTFIEALAAFNPYAIKRWFQAVWMARELQPSSDAAVHCHFALSAPRVAYFLQKLNGNPFTFTAHAKDIFLKSTKGWLLRRKIEASRGVVTVSEFNRNYLLKKYAGGLEPKVHRIYNGIDLSRFHPPAFETRSTNTVLSVSRLVEKKGIEFLLQALSLLRDRGIEIQLRIAGDGPQSKVLRHLMAQLHMESQVTFLGSISQQQVAEELQHCTIFAAPCIEAADGNLDALPTVLLEALATGTPVVSTTVTGIPEIITNGEQGLLVLPANAEALANAIADMLQSAELRKRMSEAGRQRAEERFDRTRSIAELEAFLEKAHG